MKKIIYTSLFICAFTAFLAAPAFADSPSFPLCTNPQGSVIANYDTGSHAIAGQMSLQDGKDTVYSLDADMQQVTQCFCPPTELNGIQTNWLQASTLSEEEKQQLISNGWIYIANGATWGLANGPYLAQNVTYACNETGESTPPPTSVTPAPIIAVIQSADTNNSSSNNSSTNTSSSQNSPSSLPNTGDSIILIEIISAGLISLTISFLLKKIAA